MNQFIGTKIITAIAMTRLAYNVYRGWALPDNENGADEGFLVEYLDGGKGNDPRHTGYISWSPKEVFERAYRPTNAMTFGDAVVMLKDGQRVARAGWNGKGMFLEISEDEHSVYPCSNGREYRGGRWIGMKTVDDKFIPWLASQTDMLAEDWTVLS